MTSPGPASWRAVVLALSVGLAFADAAVVALALPSIYREFDTTIEQVSWVLTSYALVVAVASAVLVVVGRWVAPRALTAGGLTLFAAGSLACGLAPSLGLLIASRCVQGLGAAALIAGSLPLLTDLLGDARRARGAWAAAGTVGALVGPALGGLVTQLADWRVVFLVQAPVATAALVAVLGHRSSRLDEAAGEATRPPRTSALLAEAAFVFVFGALVGALFLGVLLLVVVWDMAPLAAAGVVSGLPLGALAVGPLARRSSPVLSVVVGGVALGGGLLALALLPAVSAWWALPAFLLCGAGFGLLSDALGPVAVPAGPGAGRAATRSSAARHAGLVVGLVLISPVLAGSILEGVERAALAGTATMLDSDVPLGRKVAIAWDLQTALDDAPEGEVPDLDTVYEQNGLAEDARVARLEADTTEAIAAALTRSFRPAFVIAALLAVLAIVPGLLAVVRARSAGAPSRWGVAAGVGLACVALAAPVVVGAAWAADARSFGTFQPVDPCRAPIDPFPGEGFDASLQRALQSGLYGAACELGTTRETLILSLDDRAPVDRVEWDDDTVERALRAGVLRTLDDADARNTLPGWIAWSLREVVERAPLSWFVERLRS